MIGRGRRNWKRRRPRCIGLRNPRLTARLGADRCRAMIGAEQYYSSERRALQQGDLVLAPFSRLQTEATPSPPEDARLAAWRRLDSAVIRWPSAEMPNSPP